VKLVFHVGAPKTATTSLQHALKDVRGRLQVEGVTYVPIGKLRNSEFGEALRNETPSLLRRVSRGQVRGFVENWVEDDTQQLLISEEGWSSYLIHPRRHGSWARQAKRTFRIVDHFSAYDFRVVLTVRRQDSYLLSSYAHLVRHGRVHLPFESFWKDGWDLETMSWLGFVEEFVKEYGTERFVVLPYEHIRDDFGAYFRTFLGAACNIPEATIADMNPEPNELNQSLSEPAMDIARIINKHLNRDVPVHRLKALIKDIRDILPTGDYPKFSADIEEVRAAMAKLFTAENRTLNEKFFIRPHRGFEF
jgi:hypothetical protein